VIRRTGIVFIACALFVSQCKVAREVSQPGPEPVTIKGMEGLRQRCLAADTVVSILISKAEAMISTEEERYEATVTLYSVIDSLIYLSAVNSGFEILRAALYRDSIRVIDRLNKVVYKTAVKKRFGYQHPVNFADVQNLISSYYLCDNLQNAREINFSDLVFNFDEPHVRKQIVYNKETLQMDHFEFSHQQTGKYLKGEREENRFRIQSNFMITTFEIQARGGEVSYNRDMDLDMGVPTRKYSIVYL